MKVLIVDDDTGALESLAALVELAGHDPVCASSGEAALAAFNNSFECVLLDLWMPGRDGFSVQDEILQKNPLTTIIIVSATDRARETVKALKGGAFDFIAKPFASEDILRCLAAAEKASAATDDPEKVRLVGSSRAIRELTARILQVAPTNAPVLIEGESGTGKELVARAIHQNGPNPHEPFFAVNCAAIPEQLFESELFGYERGAFTGANTSKVGKMEFARRGTFFLDEINSLSMEGQTKLLRVLEDKCFQRVGGTATIPFEARVIAASNSNLREMVEKGTFRQDMYYRLNVVNMTITPLRERPEDIRPLMEHFLRHFARQHHKQVSRIEPDTLFVLAHYPWPGNVRELRNIIERAVIFTPDGEAVGKRMLAEPLLFQGEEFPDEERIGIKPLNEEMQDREKRYLCTCLNHFDWNVAQTAKALGVHRNTLFNKINAYSLQRADSAAR